jgi:hypothetical protein
MRVPAAYIVVGVVAALASQASLAHATCILRSWASPGGAVPLRGSVFTYTDGGFENKPPHVTWRGGQGTATSIAVSSTITRVDYQGPEGATLVVRPGHYDREESGHTFELSARTPLAVPRVTSIVRSKGAWSCSSYDYLAITLDAPVAALRARWTREDLTFADHWIVDDRVFELGMVDCGGTTLSPRDIDAGGSLALTAILADGSEHAIYEGVILPTLPVLDLPAPPVLGTPVLPVHDQPTGARIGVIREPRDVPWGAVVLSLVLVVFAARATFGPTASILPIARATRRTPHK